MRMTLERLHIQGQLAPEGEMCKLFSEDSASAVHGSLLALQGSLAQGWRGTCTSPLPISPGAGRVQGSPQGPCLFSHLCSCPGPALYATHWTCTTIEIQQVAAEHCLAIHSQLHLG